MNANADIEAMLSMRSVAVIGCSPRRERASHRIAAYLIEEGFRVLPVNPGHERILGERCYESLSAIDEPVEFAVVFRRSEHVPGIAEEAIAAGIKGLWLQDGVDHPEAAAKARAAGIRVVVDDCVMRQHLSRMGR